MVKNNTGREKMLTLQKPVRILINIEKVTKFHELSMIY